jgi:hypothetical protein
METSQPRRRLRLSLRVLLLVIAMIGAGFGWIVDTSRGQRATIAFIEANGGAVSYDWAQQSDVSLMKPSGPAWLRRIVGDELFQDIGGIQLNGSIPRRAQAPPDEVFRRLLRAGPRITTLFVSEWGLNAAAYRAIGQFKNLETFTLTNERITEADVASLRGLANLKTLEIIISDCPITNQSLRSISQLTDLETLILCESPYGLSSEDQAQPILDEGLDCLSRLPKLEFLTVWNIRLTDRGFDHLARFNKLKRLELRGPRESEISARGLQRLKTVRSLDELTLYVGQWNFSIGPSPQEPTPAEKIDEEVRTSIESQPISR